MGTNERQTHTDRLKISIAIVLAAMSLKCGGSANPVTPTTPTSTTFTLSGIVSSGGAAVAGAVITVLDGPNANQTAATSTDGRYSFASLKSGGFTIRTTAPDYVTTTQPVTLIANQTANIELVKLPRAVLVSVPEALVAVAQPDGTFGYAPTGQNTGTGCAGSVAGTTDVTINGSLLKTLAWALPPATLVRPTDRFTYQICCLTRAEAFTPGIGYFTHFTWVTAGC